MHVRNQQSSVIVAITVFALLLALAFAVIPVAFAQTTTATTTPGTVTPDPGFPNTGFGGNAAANFAIVASTGLIALGAAALLLTRRFDL